MYVMQPIQHSAGHLQSLKSMFVCMYMCVYVYMSIMNISRQRIVCVCVCMCVCGRFNNSQAATAFASCRRHFSDHCRRPLSLRRLTAGNNPVHSHTQPLTYTQKHESIVLTQKYIHSDLLMLQLLPRSRSVCR